MPHKQKHNVHLKERRAIIGKLTKDLKQMRRHLEFVEIVILDTAPQDREAFVAAYKAHRRQRLNTGLLAFIRHEMTNYNAINSYVDKRWPDRKTPRDLKDAFRERINRVAWQYLREIGADDLWAPNVTRLKIEPKVILPALRNLC